MAAAAAVRPTAEAEQSHRGCRCSRLETTRLPVFPARDYTRLPVFPARDYTRLPVFPARDYTRLPVFPARDYTRDNILL